jgi:hypothetical protein
MHYKFITFSVFNTISICRYVLGAVETFLDAIPSAGFFQGALLQCTLNSCCSFVFEGPL